MFCTTLATAIVASNRTTVEGAICNAFIRSVTRAILIDKCITFVRTHRLRQDLLQCHRLSHRWNFHHFHQPIWTVIEAFVSSNRITVERAICSAFFLAPSSGPSLEPSSLPSTSPSQGPTSMPSALPSIAPSSDPSLEPSIWLSTSPASQPSMEPSVRSPTSVPS